MRNFIVLTAAVTVLMFAALLFSSCVQNEEAMATESSLTEWGSTEHIKEIDVVTSEPVLTGSDDESDACVKEIVHEALDAYALFVSKVPEIDHDDSVECEEGMAYYKVTDQLINTFDKLQSYMQNYFSDDIVKQLLNTERYMQFEDGSLYVLDIDMSAGTNIISEKFNVKEQTKDKEAYTVTVVMDNNDDGTPDATETYDFMRELSESEGKWVFTEFVYYR